MENTFSGKKSTECQYANYWNDTQHGPLTGLVVYWNNYITGIQPMYGTTASNQFVGSVQNQFSEKYMLEEGDYIAEVFGRSGDFIDCFGIKTGNGYTKVWGNPLGGGPFSYGKSGHYIKSFKVGVTSHLCYFEPIFDLLLLMWSEEGKLSKEQKCTETICKPNSSTVNFNDAKSMENIFNFEVASLTIVHDDYCVFGLSTSYYMDGDKTSFGNHVKNDCTGKKSTIELEQKEHLVKMIVNFSDVIVGLGFWTDKGKFYYYGSKECNMVKVFTLPDKYHFVSFSGGCNSGLTWIQGHFDQFW